MKKLIAILFVAVMMTGSAFAQGSATLPKTMGPSQGTYEMSAWCPSSLSLNGDDADLTVDLGEYWIPSNNDVSSYDSFIWTLTGNHVGRNSSFSAEFTAQTTADGENITLTVEYERDYTTTAGGACESDAVWTDLSEFWTCEGNAPCTGEAKFSVHPKTLDIDGAAKPGSYTFPFTVTVTEDTI